MPAARRFPRGLIRALAWLVTAGLLYVLFRRIPFSEVVAAARAAPGWGVPAAVGGTLLIYLCDSFAIWKTFGWFLARMSFSDVLLVRGATYLLAAINYNVGQGAIVYFVHKSAGTTIIRGVATILLVLGINVLALLFLATGGMAVAPALPHLVKVIIAVAWGGLAVYVAVRLIPRRWGCPLCLGAGAVLPPPLGRPPAVRGLAEPGPWWPRARASGSPAAHC